MTNASGSLVCLISVSNQRFTKALISRFGEWAALHEMALICIVLDGPERHNVAVFEKRSAEDADAEARTRGASLMRELAAPGVCFIDWAEAKAAIQWHPAFAMLKRQYGLNGPFRRHCLSQTFSSLRPRFRQIGVNNKKHPAVERCVQYLLEEIALKIALVRSGRFRGEIMPVPETDLMMAIYGDRYFELGLRRNQFLIVTYDGLQALCTQTSATGS